MEETSTVTLEHAAQAMSNLQTEAMLQRNARQLKRECRNLIEESPSERLASTLEVDAVRRRQAHQAKWEWNAED